MTSYDNIADVIASIEDYQMGVFDEAVANMTINGESLPWFIKSQINAMIEDTAAVLKRVDTVSDARYDNETYEELENGATGSDGGAYSTQGKYGQGYYGSTYSGANDYAKRYGACTENEENLLIAPKRPCRASMLRAFQGCKSLIAIGDLDVSEVTNCERMFYGCSSLASLPEDFNPSSATNCERMFNGCSSLVSLPEGFNPSSATNCTYMFYGCSSLQSLDVSAWDMSGVTSCGNMFNGCSSLTSLDVSAWNMSSVTSCIYMFYGCSSLQSLDVSSWDMSSVTSCGNMFNGCSGLTSLDVSSWDMSSVTSCTSMFNGCSGLTSLDVSSWDMSSVTSCSSMFYGCSGLTSIKLGTMSSGAIVNLDQTFRYCTSLKSLDMSGINLTGCYVGDDYSRVRNAFAGCSALEDFSLGVSPKIDWSLGASPLLTKESVINVLNSLYDFRGDEAYGYNEEMVGIAEGDDGFDDAYCGDGCGFAAGFVHPTLTLHSTVYNKIFVNDDCWMTTDETFAELLCDAYDKGWLIS